MPFAIMLVAERLSQRVKPLRGWRRTHRLATVSRTPLYGYLLSICGQPCSSISFPDQHVLFRAHEDLQRQVSTPMTGRDGARWTHQVLQGMRSTSIVKDLSRDTEPTVDQRSCPGRRSSADCGVARALLNVHSTSAHTTLSPLSLERHLANWTPA